jgi:iron(III) transport system substrate-binding protein
MKRKRTRLALVVLMLTMMIFSCHSMAKVNNVLHMYTALDTNEAKIYIEAFQKDTKINVEWVRLSAGEVLTRLKAEAKNPQVSVWFGGSAVEQIAGRNAGLLAPYASPKAKYLKTDTTLRDDDWYWTGIYFGAIGFACNSQWFEKHKVAYPTSWQDLLKPELKENVTIAYPYTSGTSFTTLASLVTLMGEDKAYDYWKKLDGNVKNYTSAGSAPVTNCGLGEVAVGIAFSHDILAKGKAKGYPVKMSFPKEGTGYEIGAISLVKGGPEPQLGKKFIDWMMTKRAQDLMQQWFRIPLNPAAEIADGAVKASEVKLVKLNSEWIGSNNARLIEKWRKTIGK